MVYGIVLVWCLGPGLSFAVAGNNLSCYIRVVSILGSRHLNPIMLLLLII